MERTTEENVRSESRPVAGCVAPGGGAHVLVASPSGEGNVSTRIPKATVGFFVFTEERAF